MEHQNIGNVMIFLALVTPGLALLIGYGLRRSVEEGGASTSRLRRNVWILGAAGPANLLLWLVLNGLLDGLGWRSVVGYVLAALTFVAAGLATGFLARLFSVLRGRRRLKGDSESRDTRE